VTQQQQQQAPSFPTGKSASKTVLSTVLGAGLFLGFWGGIGWVLLRPWIAPEGTPLERCLKGRRTPEFLEEDRERLQTLKSVFRESYEDLAAHYENQRNRHLLDLSSEELSALMDAQFKDLRRVREEQLRVFESACRDAASRIENAAPVAAPAEP